MINSRLGREATVWRWRWFSRLGRGTAVLDRQSARPVPQEVHAEPKWVHHTVPVIGFPAPALCQGADEDLMLQLGAIIFPESLRRWQRENGFRIWVDGSPEEPATRSEAVARFQIVLGVLRAWRPDAGELQDERRAGLGEGTIRDEAGNQRLILGPAIFWTTSGADIEQLAENTRRGIAQSQPLDNALWLNGRANRTAADYYMIHEYARRGLGGNEGIRHTTGISIDAQKSLTKSANRLSPLDGGRHANDGEKDLMSLNEQRVLISGMLRSWIDTFAHSPG
jgi:hypothetical protein